MKRTKTLRTHLTNAAIKTDHTLRNRSEYETAQGFSVPAQKKNFHVSKPTGEKTEDVPLLTQDISQFQRPQSVSALEDVFELNLITSFDVSFIPFQTFPPILFQSQILTFFKINPST